MFFPAEHPSLTLVAKSLFDATRRVNVNPTFAALISQALEVAPHQLEILLMCQKNVSQTRSVCVQCVQRWTSCLSRLNLGASRDTTEPDERTLEANVHRVGLRGCASRFSCFGVAVVGVA